MKLSFLTQLAAKIPADDAGIQKVEAENLVSGVLATVYFVAGIVAVLIIIVAGIFYVTSDGEAAKIKRAKDAILYSIVGLVVVMTAFVITQFLIGRF